MLKRLSAKKQQAVKIAFVRRLELGLVGSHAISKPYEDLFQRFLEFASEVVQAECAEFVN